MEKYSKWLAQYQLLLLHPSGSNGGDAAAGHRSIEVREQPCSSVVDWWAGDGLQVGGYRDVTRIYTYQHHRSRGSTPRAGVPPLRARPAPTCTPGWPRWTRWRSHLVSL